MLYLIFLITFLSSCQTPKQIIKEENPAKQVVIDHAYDQEERYGFELVASGISDEEEVETFSLHFISYKKMKVPSVRRIVVLSVEDFLKRVNGNPKVKPRLKHHPIEIDNIKFNIGFAHHNGDFREPPYIGYAYLKDRKIHYCYYDNLFGKFTNYDDIEEPYEMAKQMVLEAKNG